jgi:hypothetical protein
MHTDRLLNSQLERIPRPTPYSLQSSILEWSRFPFYSVVFPLTGPATDSH